MKNSETPSSPSSYVGHVRNGVVILDAHISLADGQAVRVEPLGTEPAPQDRAEIAARVQKLQQLFATWTEEDAKLPEEEADRLRIALEQNRGLHFRSATPD